MASGSPSLLRRAGRRRIFGRLVVATGLVATLVLAPGGAAGAPVITPVIFGTLGTNGWYTSNITINWLLDGPVESTEGCNARTLSADTTGTTLTCSATRDGYTTTVSKTFRIDKSAPAVATALERQPDANGWYNRPVTIAFTGTDATSGIQGCGDVRYAGPDSSNASVSGTCKDFAGNVAGGSVAIKYDATPPSLYAVTAKVANRSAEIAWRMSADTAAAEVVRAPGRGGQGETVVYRGSETGFQDTGLVVGRKYEYRVVGIDQAANRVENKLEITATGALLSPLPGAVVAAPPKLVWTAVVGASYYNVQLLRGRKILSAWPSSPRIQLPRSWRYKGRRYRLRPGSYRWYVWPGYGRRSAAKYGHLLGGSTFVVAR